MDIGGIADVFGPWAWVVVIVVLLVAVVVLGSREYDRHQRRGIERDRFRLEAQRAADQEAQTALSEMLAKLEGLLPDLDARRELEAALAPESASDQRPWSDSDMDLARQLWGRLSGPGRELFSHLARNPHLRFSGDELAERMGLANGFGVAGVAAWPAIRARQLGRPSPISWNQSDGKYWMDPVPASFFAQLASIGDLRPN